MTRAEKSIGQHLQNWLIRNAVAVTDPLFVDAVDVTLLNYSQESAAVKGYRARYATTGFGLSEENPDGSAASAQA